MFGSVGFWRGPLSLTPFWRRGSTCIAFTAPSSYVAGGLCWVPRMDVRDIFAAFWWGLGAGLLASFLRNLLRRL
jgi:hypothetical protein